MHSSVYCKDKNPCNCVCLYCPVHHGIFCIDKQELLKPEIRCPVCGTILVLMPKDLNVMWQSLLYKEMQMLLRKIEKQIGGD